MHVNKDPNGGGPTKDVEYVRKGRTITQVAPKEDNPNKLVAVGDPKQYDSINKAKKQSWELQGGSESLGLGKVRVI